MWLTNMPRMSKNVQENASVAFETFQEKVLFYTEWYVLLHINRLIV